MRTPGSIEPGRVPITSPSSVENPMVVAMHFHTGPITEMRHDQALRHASSDARHGVKDRFVGQAMKAVATQTRLPKFVRESKPRRELGLRRMESGVEARDLRELWQHLP
jgi:hypothetical protein